MLDRYLPGLPYELIGQAVVLITLLILALAVLLVGIVAVLFVWCRGWARVSNRMWKGYDHKENRPPLWKMRVSGVTIALSRFKFRKIPAAYREAETLTDDDTTLRQYLSRVFLSEQT